MKGDGLPWTIEHGFLCCVLASSSPCVGGRAAGMSCVDRRGGMITTGFAARAFRGVSNDLRDRHEVAGVEQVELGLLARDQILILDGRLG